MTRSMSSDAGASASILCQLQEGLQENLEPRLHKFGGMEYLKVGCLAPGMH